MLPSLLGTLLVCTWTLTSLSIMTAQSTSPTYLISCSEYIRAGEDFKVDVGIIGGNGNVQVTATIVIINTNTNVVIREVAAATMDFDIGQSALITLTIPEDLTTVNTLEEYRIQVAGTGGLPLNEYRTLQLLTKSKSIFVQTDKAIYKPGDLVQFRAFVVDMELIPLPGPIDVKISDPAGNRIAQWLDQTPPSGLFSGDLQLSDHVNLGDWTIMVEHQDDSYEKIIKIAEYVLPRFKVEVILPSYVIVPGRQLAITVKAVYTYGQPVIGTANIRIRRRHAYSSSYYSYQLFFSNRQLEADGTYSMTVDVDDLCQPACSAYLLTSDIFVVEANVTETATGMVLSGNATPAFSQHGTEIKFMDATPDSFKIGFPFVPYVQVTRRDGTLWNTLTLNVTFGGRLDCSTQLDCEEYDIPEITKSVPSNGIISFNVDLSELPQGYQSMHLHASVVDPETQQNIISQTSVSAFLSVSNEAIQITQQSSNDDLLNTIQPGTTVIFNVQTTAAVTIFSYQIYSKSHLVQSGQVETSGNDHLLVLNVDSALAKDISPTARIIVYYITSSGELLADTLLVNVDGAFTNDVSVVYSNDEVAPDDAVNVAGTAAPDSIVALLAVDQSVLLLQSGNDITQEQVLADHALYDVGSPSGAVTGYCYYCYRGTDVTELFRNNHVHVLTNAIMYPEYTPPTSPQDPFITRMTSASMLFTRPILPADWGIFHAATWMDGGAEEIWFSQESGILSQVAPAPWPQFPFSTVTEPTITEPDLTEITTIRELFEETWIFREINSGADGSFRLSNLEVPDTITSWVLSAFALHDTAGLGIANTARLNVFKPFFVSLSLPYSIIRGEMFALKVTVFNYLGTTQNVKLTLPYSNDLAVLVNGTKGHHQVEGWVYGIQPQAARTVVIWIRPSVIGFIDIELHAQSSVAADGVRRMLLVKAEGEPRETVESVYVIKQANTAFTHTFLPFFPNDVVNDSQRLYTTATGHTLGSTMANLDELLQMPTGCGEQNMLKFAPDVFVMQYLTATDQTTSDIVNTAISYMNSGYQRELTYKRDDHSYSAFGQRDASGSTWLTAFVIKTFHQAIPFLPIIDEDIIVSSLEWILAQQNSNGAFSSVGRVIHDELLGGSSDGVALSAFVTIAILECADLANSTSLDLEAAISLALTFLEDAAPSLVSNPYGLAISAYALALADSPVKGIILGLLDNHAIIEGDMKYWSESQETHSSTTDIEMTAYGLLATLLNDDGVANGIPIAKWLTSKQNKLGGYSSTQDTVVALQAMTQFTIHTFTSGDQNLELEVTVDGVEHVRFDTITEINSDILATQDLPASSLEVVLTAYGTGTAIVKVVSEYNIPVPDPPSQLTLGVDIINYSDNTVQLDNCIGWNQQEDAGMTVVSVQPLSGFTNDQAGLIEQYEQSGLRMTEIRDNNLVLYFDEVPQGETCVRTTQTRQFSVTGLQSGSVSVYRYYSPETRANVLYLPDALAGENVTQACPECVDDDFELVISTPSSGTRLIPVLSLLLLAAVIP